MIHLRPQTLLGSFALITLLLAGAAVGHLLGIGLDEALYLTVLGLIAIGWRANRRALRQPHTPIDLEET